jgi:hypothetical protein
MDTQQIYLDIIGQIVPLNCSQVTAPVWKYLIIQPQVQKEELISIYQLLWMKLGSYTLIPGCPFKLLVVPLDELQNSVERVSRALLECLCGGLGDMGSSAGNQTPVSKCYKSTLLLSYILSREYLFLIPLHPPPIWPVSLRIKTISNTDLPSPIYASIYPALR